MTEPRQIAVVHDYPGLLTALRERAERLNVSRAVIDDVSGLASGYAGKLLANPPMKTLGAISLGPMLGALGLSLVLIEDPDQMRRIASRMSARNNSQVRLNANASKQFPGWLFNSRKARKAARKRWSSMTESQRKRAARKAWRTRRQRARAKAAQGMLGAPQSDQSAPAAPST